MELRDKNTIQNWHFNLSLYFVVFDKQSTDVQKLNENDCVAYAKMFQRKLNLMIKIENMKLIKCQQ